MVKKDTIGLTQGPEVLSPLQQRKLKQLQKIKGLKIEQVGDGPFPPYTIHDLKIFAKWRGDAMIGISGVRMPWLYYLAFEEIAGLKGVKPGRLLLQTLFDMIEREASSEIMAKYNIGKLTPAERKFFEEVYGDDEEYSRGTFPGGVGGSELGDGTRIVVVKEDQ
jgi:hypothetical protein